MCFANFLILPAPFFSPTNLIDQLSRTHKNIFFLDSSNTSHLSENLEDKSKFSYVGIRPLGIFEYELKKGDAREALHALKLLDKYLDQTSIPDLDSSHHLGPQYFFWASYNFGEALHSIKNEKNDPLKFPDLFCCLCQYQWIFDHEKQQVYFYSLNEKRLNEKELYQEYQSLISFQNNSKMNNLSNKKILKLKSNICEKEYLDKLNDIKQYIYNGHIYQVNFSQTFSFYSKMSSWNFYKKVIKKTPSPFSSYMRYKSFSIISTSPERFLRREDGHICTEPIKGTRPRGQTEKEEIKNKNSLANSTKEISENIMITDLLRNDLGRISKYGTVKVPNKLYIEKFASVFHLVSKVEGILKENLSFGDIISQTFPGGSITGCPKQRAMEIITEQETQKRSLYTGTLGRISINLQNFDLSIIIRTILGNNHSYQMSLGGGIVYDSNHSKEYQETFDKGQKLLESINDYLTVE